MYDSSSQHHFSPFLLSCFRLIAFFHHSLQWIIIVSDWFHFCHHGLRWIIIVSDQSPGWKFLIWNPLQLWKIMLCRKKESVIKFEREFEKVGVCDSILKESVREFERVHISVWMMEREGPCITPELHRLLARVLNRSHLRCHSRQCHHRRRLHHHRRRCLHHRRLHHCHHPHNHRAPINIVIKSHLLHC